MHFTTDLVVSIDGKTINTVHSVKTKFDSKHVGSTCDIVVPLNAQISYVDGTNDFLTSLIAPTLTTFKVGDPVIITASYPNINGPSITIFSGTVYEFKEGTPCVIRCIDYLPLLGHMQNITSYTGSLKNLVTRILQGTGISLMLPTVDLNLYKITFRTISPWAILEYIKKMIGLNIALQGDQLYVNVASNTLRHVGYSSDANLYDCKLQQPDTIWQGYKVKAWFLKENGVRDSFETGDTDGHLTEVYFYKVQADINTYTRLANEALIKIRQRKFSGHVSGYLYPEVHLFDRITYKDIRYPDRSGDYVVTEISHDISDAGFHCHMTWAFLLDVLNTPNAIG